MLLREVPLDFKTAEMAGCRFSTHGLGEAPGVRGLHGDLLTRCGVGWRQETLPLLLPPPQRAAWD